MRVRTNLNHLLTLAFKKTTSVLIVTIQSLKIKMMAIKVRRKTLASHALEIVQKTELKRMLRTERK